MSMGRLESLRLHFESPNFQRYLARNQYGGFNNTSLLFTSDIALGNKVSMYLKSNIQVIRVARGDLNMSNLSNIIRPIGAQVLIFDEDLKLPTELYNNLERLGFIVARF